LIANLPLGRVNLSHVIATNNANSGRLLQVGGRLLQPVVTPFAAYLCDERESVAGVAAFSKTFSKRNNKCGRREGKRAYRDNNRDNLPHLPHLPHQVGRQRSGSIPLARS
jgi:hypothetical protein